MNRGTRTDAIAVVAVAAACVLAIEWCGHRQWHLWDLSMVVDSAWRTYLGQRPGTDFISPLPIGFHAIGGMSLWLFGVSWSSLVHVAALWACLCVSWEFILLRAIGISREWSLGISAAICAVTLIQKSFLYHSSFTTPVAGILVTAAILALRRPGSALGLASIAASTAILLVGKQNAVLNVVLVAAIAATSRALRFRVAAALGLAAAVAAAIVVVVAGSIAPVARASMAAGAMRGRPNLTALLGIRDGLGTNAFVLDALAVALALAPILAPAARRSIAALGVRERALCAGAVLIALYGMSTNNDFKMTDLPPMIVGIFLPVVLGRARPGEGRKSAFRPEFALGAIVLIGLAAGVTRVSLSGSAGRVFTYGALVPVGTDHTFFARLSAGPRFAAIERDLTVVTAELGPRAGVFFGPALEFAYAAHGYTPPLGLPLWWHPGTSYSPARDDEIAARFTKDAPATAVFLLNDAPGLPPRIYGFLQMEYKARIVGTLMVLDRKRAELR